jgi:4-hydroxybenzoate polyprenyltransferase
MIAGGSAGLGAVLGASMLALQLSIGTLNDVVDAPRDAVAKPLKPIPAGLVRRREAIAATVVAACAGLVLAAVVRVEVLVVAFVVLGIGYAYDLLLKPTPISWLAFAVGIPLLPVFAWVGAGAALPGSFGLLLPAAAVAGAMLAVANSLADAERDRLAGVATLPVAIGARRAWLVHAGLAVALLGVAGAGAVAMGARGPGLIVAVVGAGLIVVGAMLAGHRAANRRERGWEAECLGTAMLGIGWLAAVTAGA